MNGVTESGSALRRPEAATPATHAAHETYTPELWRLPRVIGKTGRSRSSIYDAIKAGTFPRPVALGGSSVAWVSTEVQAWISARIAERDAKAVP
jgi:prophage regulatory protein